MGKKQVIRALILKIALPFKDITATGPFLGLVLVPRTKRKHLAFPSCYSGLWLPLTPSPGSLSVEDGGAMNSV